MAWDESFHGYVQASSLFLYLIRNTNDSARKSKLREVANSCLERASMIKSRKGVIEPVKRDRLARGESDRTLRSFEADLVEFRGASSSSRHLDNHSESALRNLESAGCAR